MTTTQARPRPTIPGDEYRRTLADHYIPGRILDEQRRRQWLTEHPGADTLPELPDGWRYEVTAEYDERSAAEGFDGDGFGALEWGNRYRPHPEAIAIDPDGATLADSWRDYGPRGVLWWSPISSYGDDSATRANLTAMYRARGMSKGPAYLAAVQGQQRCARYLADYPDHVGGIVVRVLDDDGSERGMASLWGIDDTFAPHGRDVDTIAADEGLYGEAWEVAEESILGDLAAGRVCDSCGAIQGGKR